MRVDKQGCLEHPKSFNFIYGKTILLELKLLGTDIYYKIILLDQNNYVGRL